MSAPIMNPNTARLILTSPNTKVFSNSDRMGTFGPSSYYSSQQLYYYPVVQSYDDFKEYYFCIKASSANVNQVVKPSQIEEHRSSEINGITYNQSNNTNTEIFVLYKSDVDFDNSTLPNKRYILTKCRAINLEFLTDYGRLGTFNYENGSEESLIYMCYANETAFFEDFDSTGIKINSVIPTLTLAAKLNSNRNIFSTIN